jgi:hypothetical protein
MWSAPTLYHASYQLPAAVPNEIRLSTVKFQELTDSDSDSEIYRGS